MNSLDEYHASLHQSSLAYASYYREYVQTNKGNYPAFTDEVSCILSALDIAVEKQLADTYIEITTNFSDYLESNGQFELARERLVQAKTLAEEMHDPVELASILYTLGRIEGTYGNPNQGRELMEKAAELARDKNNTIVCPSLLGLGIYHARRGAFDKASELMRQSLQLAQHDRLYKDIAQASLNLGAVELFRGNLEQASIYLLAGLEAARQINNLKIIANILQNLASAATHLGKWAEAEKHLSEALVIARSSDSKSEEARMLANLGGVANSSQAFDKAADYLHEAIKIADKVGDKDTKITALRNMGEAQAGLNLPDQAEKFFEQSLHLARQINDRTRIDSILCEYGEMLLTHGRATEAFPLFKEAQESATKIGTKELMGTSTYGLARVSLTQSDRKQARYWGIKSKAAYVEGNHAKAAEVTHWLKENGLFEEPH